MSALQLDDLRQHSDILRTRAGQSLTVRFVEPGDSEALQGYFRSLSVGSRYNRFLGAMRELPPTELDHFIHVGEGDRFSVIAVMAIDGVETVIGEARYAFEPDTASFEFGLSIDDRWQGQGVGSALLKNSGMPCRRVRRRAAVRRYLALEQRHDRPGAQIRFCLHPQPRRLEAGALRKTRRRRAEGNSLRELAAGGATDGG